MDCHGDDDQLPMHRFEMNTDSLECFGAPGDDTFADGCAAWSQQATRPPAKQVGSASSLSSSAGSPRPPAVRSVLASGGRSPPSQRGSLRSGSRGVGQLARAGSAAAAAAAAAAANGPAAFGSSFTSSSSATGLRSNPSARESSGSVQRRFESPAGRSSKFGQPSVAARRQRPSSASARDSREGGDTTTPDEQPPPAPQLRQRSVGQRNTGEAQGRHVHSGAATPPVEGRVSASHAGAPQRSLSPPKRMNGTPPTSPLMSSSFDGAAGSVLCSQRTSKPGQRRRPDGRSVSPPGGTRHTQPSETSAWGPCDPSENDPSKQNQQAMLVNAITRFAESLNLQSAGSGEDAGAAAVASLSAALQSLVGGGNGQPPRFGATPDKTPSDRHLFTDLDSRLGRLERSVAPELIADHETRLGRMERSVACGTAGPRGQSPRRPGERVPSPNAREPQQQQQQQQQPSQACDRRELDASRSRCSRLEHEVGELRAQAARRLDAASREADAAKREAAEARAQTTTLQAIVNDLGQQLEQLRSSVSAVEARSSILCSGNAEPHIASARSHGSATASPAPCLSQRSTSHSTHSTSGRAGGGTGDSLEMPTLAMSGSTNSNVVLTPRSTSGQLGGGLGGAPPGAVANGQICVQQGSSAPLHLHHPAGASHWQPQHAPLQPHQQPQQLVYVHPASTPPAGGNWCGAVAS